MSHALKHQPVLAPEILQLLPVKTLNRNAGLRALDSTFGRGGHTTALLKQDKSVVVIAVDKDSEAVEWGVKHLKLKFPRRLHLAQADFHEYSYLEQNIFPGFIQNKGFDIIILDLGPSSPQLDTAKRGFSFYKEGPLDMRMNRSQSFSAGDIINQWPEKKLKDLFYSYGEIQRPGPVVQAICKERKTKPFTTTLQLSKLIQKKISWKQKGRHPAAPYFLALRLAVNNELEGLSSALPKMITALNPGGRIFVLSFHSLEDRIVKNIFREKHKKEGLMVNKKVIRPGREEIKKNPRARSALLRVFEKS